MFKNISANQKGPHLYILASFSKTNKHIIQKRESDDGKIFGKLKGGETYTVAGKALLHTKKPPELILKNETLKLDQCIMTTARKLDKKNTLQLQNTYLLANKNSQKVSILSNSHQG